MGIPGRRSLPAPISSVCRTVLLSCSGTPCYHLILDFITISYSWQDAVTLHAEMVFTWKWKGLGNSRYFLPIYCKTNSSSEPSLLQIKPSDCNTCSLADRVPEPALSRREQAKVFITWAIINCPSELGRCEERLSCSANTLRAQVEISRSV